MLRLQILYNRLNASCGVLLRFGAVFENIIALCLSVTNDLIGAGVGLLNDSLCEHLRPHERLADLGLFLRQSAELFAQTVILLGQRKSLCADIVQQGVDLVRVIVFFLDDLNVDRVKKSLIECHTEHLSVLCACCLQNRARLGSFGMHYYNKNAYTNQPCKTW